MFGKFLAQNKERKSREDNFFALKEFALAPRKEKAASHREMPGVRPRQPGAKAHSQTGKALLQSKSGFRAEGEAAAEALPLAEAEPKQLLWRMEEAVERREWQNAVAILGQAVTSDAFCALQDQFIDLITAMRSPPLAAVAVELISEQVTTAKLEHCLRQLELVENLASLHQHAEQRAAAIKAVASAELRQQLCHIASVLFN